MGGFKDALFGKDPQVQSQYQQKHAGLLENMLTGMAMGTAFKNVPGLGKMMKNEDGQNFMSQALGSAENANVPKTSILPPGYGTPSGGFGGGAANPMNGILAANGWNFPQQPKNTKGKMYSY